MSIQNERDAADEVLGGRSGVPADGVLREQRLGGHRPLHFALTYSWLACGTMGALDDWTGALDVFERAGLAACQDCRKALGAPEPSRGADERAPGLSERGESAAEEREQLASALYEVFLMRAKPWSMRDAFRLVANEVLRRYPRIETLETAGDQSQRDEIVALRKALADAEERHALKRGEFTSLIRGVRGVLDARDGEGLTAACKRVADRLRDSESIIRNAIDADTLARKAMGCETHQTTAEAVERVVNEREAWRKRATDAEWRENEARDSGTPQFVALMREYLSAAPRETLTDAAFRVRRLRQNLADSTRERDEARSVLAAVRKALGGGLS